MASHTLQTPKYRKDTASSNFRGRCKSFNSYASFTNL